tara:strand:+ start:386 stop:727 length:342 start_codon:yes stop_codon:yes gene_type:complete
MNEVHTIQISQETVNEYALISGDDNPIHQNSSFARDQGFDGTIVHGMFVLSLMREYFSVHTNFDDQSKLVLNARFKKPVYVGEEITFLVENKEKIVAKNSKNEVCVDVSKPNI